MVKHFLNLLEKLDFYSIPEPNSGCLLWTGAVMGIGHGKVWWDGRHWPAHRAAWICAHGEPPAKQHVCHKCDVPACINIDHLFLGSGADNSKDMARKGRGTGVFSASDVVAIRADPRSVVELARIYGVSVATIYSARRGQYYSWVPPNTPTDSCNRRREQ